MRTSRSPTRARMGRPNAPSMSVMCVPGLAPGMTQRLPGLGGRASRTRTADGDKWTVRAPVFPSTMAHLGLVEIDVLPAQSQDFVSAAARQHQQADRRDRAGGYPAALARDFVEHVPEAGELRVGQEPLPFPLGVHRDELAGIVAVLGRHVPAPMASAYMWRRVSTAMFAIAGVSHRLSCSAMTCRRSTGGDRQFAERRHDVAVDDAAGRPLRLRLAADSDMLFEIAVGQVGHRRAACVLRRERKGNRVLPGLDPRDDERGPLARLLGAEHRVAADRYPPWLVRPR